MPWLPFSTPEKTAQATPLDRPGRERDEHIGAGIGPDSTGRPRYPLL